MRESITNPTNSYKTQLREFLHYRLNGALEGPISIHETFAGVELSPEHTEVMDIRAILTAAGLIEYPEEQEDTEERCEDYSEYMLDDAPEKNSLFHIRYL